MQKTFWIIGIGLTVAILVGLGFVFWYLRIEPKNTTNNLAIMNANSASDISTNSVIQNTVANNTTPRSTSTPMPKLDTLAEPIAEFKSRITKKPFGKYFSPANSPVQPEHFTGYHTADDVEYGDTTADVPVFAITDGRVILSRVVSGYGGVFMMQFRFKDKPYTALYGHIRPSTMPKVGTEVQKGQKIGVLGTAYTSETDGERKHLHFAVLPGATTNIKGYVQSQAELSAWINPLSLYP